MCNRQLPKNSAEKNRQLKISKRNLIVNGNYTAFNAKCDLNQEERNASGSMHFSDDQWAILPGSIVSFCDSFLDPGLILLLPVAAINADYYERKGCNLGFLSDFRNSNPLHI